MAAWDIEQTERKSPASCEQHQFLVGYTAQNTLTKDTSKDRCRNIVFHSPNTPKNLMREITSGIRYLKIKLFFILSNYKYVLQDFYYPSILSFI